MKEPWMVFYYGDRELAAYTLRGSFAGEREETVALLAAEKNIPPEEIRAVCEWRS